MQKKKVYLSALKRANFLDLPLLAILKALLPTVLEMLGVQTEFYSALFVCLFFNNFYYYKKYYI